MGDVRGASFLYFVNISNLIKMDSGDAAYVRQCLEDSIERLGTTPDLYYQHRVDPKV